MPSFPFISEPLVLAMVPTECCVTKSPVEDGPAVVFERGLLGVEEPCPLGTRCWPVLTSG